MVNVFCRSCACYPSLLICVTQFLSAFTQVLISRWMDGKQVGVPRPLADFRIGLNGDRARLNICKKLIGHAIVFMAWMNWWMVGADNHVLSFLRFVLWNPQSTSTLPNFTIHKEGPKQCGLSPKSLNLEHGIKHKVVGLLLSKLACWWLLWI